MYGRESYKERVFYCPQPHSLDLFVLFTLFKFHFFIYRAPGLIAWARGEFIWNYKVLRLMIIHFDIRDKVMKILINIDCKVYRICIIRGNFCLRNLAKILLLWSLRKLLRWRIKKNATPSHLEKWNAFHCTEFVKINHRTLLYKEEFAN